MNKRKGPPYEVEFGKEGQEPPAYVRNISENKIILGGLFKKLGLNHEIIFPEKNLVESNPELIELMTMLNDKGVVFSYDPKTMISPSWFMKNLQAKGLLKKPFKEISWRNQKLWLLTTYELA